MHITPRSQTFFGQILSDKDEEDTENVRPSSGLIIGETATRFVIMSEGLSIDEEQNRSTLSIKMVKLFQVNSLLKVLSLILHLFP